MTDAQHPAPSQSAFTKTLFIQIAISMWVLFSVGYIVVDQWQDFKEKAISDIQGDALTKARQGGHRDAIHQLMQLSEKCSPIDVSNDTNKVQMINVACLQQRQGNAQAAASAPNAHAPSDAPPPPTPGIRPPTSNP